MSIRGRGACPRLPTTSATPRRPSRCVADTAASATQHQPLRSHPKRDAAAAHRALAGRESAGEGRPRAVSCGACPRWPISVLAWPPAVNPRLRRPRAATGCPTHGGEVPGLTAGDHAKCGPGSRGKGQCACPLRRGGKPRALCCAPGCAFARTPRPVNHFGNTSQTSTLRRRHCSICDTTPASAKSPKRDAAAAHRALAGRESAGKRRSRAVSCGACPHWPISVLAARIARKGAVCVSVAGGGEPMAPFVAHRAAPSRVHAAPLAPLTTFATPRRASCRVADTAASATQHVGLQSKRSEGSERSDAGPGLEQPSRMVRSTHRGGRGGLGPPLQRRDAPVCAFRRQGRLSVEWRCRESNPGPMALHKGFSVCSPRCLYSDPPVMRASRCDDPSRCLMFRSTPRPGRTVSPLNDVGHRSGDIPGPTGSS